jgi:AcrR family transcriptional regulator
MTAHVLPATRHRNMDARRARILAQASCMLAGGGLAGLTLRELAGKAGVTVPTIYNLVGAKEQVVAALIEAALDGMDAALSAAPGRRGIARAEAAVRASADLYFADPERYGAVFRVVQDLQSKPGGAVLNPLFRRAGEVFCLAVREAQQDGDLHGRLQPVPLGHHILHAQVETFRLWGIGALPEAAARARAFYALYASLLADATKPTRRMLIDRLRESEAVLTT